MLFYLGTHQPGWLGTIAVPLFVSHRRLRARKTFPRALAPWGCDSGGFTELALHGAWVSSPGEYAASVRRYRDEVGNLSFAAIQDWICHPQLLQKTGLSVAEHQRRTVQSYLDLSSMAPDLPWLPVLQGWELADYLRCADLYAAKGIELKGRFVGVGTLAMRQESAAAQAIVSVLHGRGLRLHAFGYKRKGLVQSHAFLASSDSMAWSYEARKKKLAFCLATHINCGNCSTYALWWRDNLLKAIAGAARPQLHLGI